MTSYEKKREVIFAVTMTAISALLLARSCMYAPESSGFPRFLTGLMLLFSLILLTKSWRTRSAPINADAVHRTFRQIFGLPAFVIGGAILYAIGIKYVGYFASTMLFFLGAMVFYGKNKLWKALVASVSFMAVMYGLFVRFLGMRLPDGLLY
ncbi:MAG: tripartite tricarboxylate transporter TctB family protein [Candidatus Accumulibacter sp.]|jgi:hypothetical protein|nr:tripartite tricarboxylate transporter TctB family protein [Accumulibacter sp.]